MTKSPSPHATCATLTSAALSVVVGAVLGGFFEGAPLGNDNSSHFAEITYIAKLLRLGETDFWFDQTNLGYPLFLAYQPGPSLLMGALTALCHGWLESMWLFKLSCVLIWALMPSAWYCGGRWLGMDRLSALIFGLMVLLVSDFRAFGLGLVSLTTTGLYTQSYGTLLLPLTVGAFHRHLFVRDFGLKVPTLLFSATLLTHAYFGLYAALAAVVMILVRRDGIFERARRLGAVFALSGLLTAFWLIPFLLYIDYQGGLPWKNESENGYPPLELARLALTGELFDHNRLPWMSALVAIGIWLAWRSRARPLERFTLMLMGITIVLLLGRTTWGGLYALIPLHGQLEVIRYLNGVHFCGLLLAAPAAAFLVTRASAWMGSLPATPSSRRRTTLVPVTAVLGGLLCASAVTTARHMRSVEESKLHLPGLLAALSTDSSSRFLSHKKLGTGSHFYLNLLSTLSGRPQLESFSRGYHDTLSLYYVENFDFREESFQLYNVGTAAVRAKSLERVPKFMRRSWTDGKFYVFEYPEPGGYFEFVRTPFTLVGDFKQIRRVAAILSPRLFAAGILPKLSPQARPDDDNLIVLPRARASLVRGEEMIAENEPALRILSSMFRRYGTRPSESRVVEQRNEPNQYSATVDATGSPERLLLKASFHPLWTAEVDGELAEVLHVAPNLMAVDVPEGRHHVRFRYRNPAYQKFLFVGSVLFSILWCGAGVLRRRRRAVPY